MFRIITIEQDEQGCKSVYGVIEFPRSTTREQYRHDRRAFRAEQPRGVAYEYDFDIG